MRSSVVLAVVASSLACTPKVVSVEVTPPTTSLSDEGAAVVLVATPKSKKGEAVEKKKVVWSSSDAAVASVDSNGEVRALGSGKATISAMVDEIAGSATVDVVLLKKLQLPATAEVTVGQTLPALKLEFFNEKGEPIDGSKRQLTWSTDDHNVATVAADGTMSGVTAATTHIIAAVGDVKARTTLTVTPAAPPPLKTDLICDDRQVFHQVSVGGRFRVHSNGDAEFARQGRPATAKLELEDRARLRERVCAVDSWSPGLCDGDNSCVQAYRDKVWFHVARPSQGSGPAFELWETLTSLVDKHGADRR